MSFHRLPDPLEDTLRACGLTVTDHTLSDRPGSLYIGPRFHICRCEMIYRRPEPGLLLIVLYRRLAEKPGTLGNPFGDLLWFLNVCTQPEFELNRIMGYVSTYGYWHEDGLSDQRLTQFYQRFFNAEWINYDGNPWLYKDVDSLRIRLAQVQHKINRLNQFTDDQLL